MLPTRSTNNKDLKHVFSSSKHNSKYNPNIEIPKNYNITIAPIQASYPKFPKPLKYPNHSVKHDNFSKNYTVTLSSGGSTKTVKTSLIKSNNDSFVYFVSNEKNINDIIDPNSQHVIYSVVDKTIQNNLCVYKVQQNHYLDNLNNENSICKNLDHLNLNKDIKNIIENAIKKMTPIEIKEEKEKEKEKEIKTNDDIQEKKDTEEKDKTKNSHAWWHPFTIGNKAKEKIIKTVSPIVSFFFTK